MTYVFLHMRRVEVGEQMNSQRILFIIVYSTPFCSLL